MATAPDAAWVVAPASRASGKFRILSYQWRGMYFAPKVPMQSKLTEQYNDLYRHRLTGVGHGGLQNVKAFLPPSGSLSTTPTLKRPRYSRPTTLSATAV